MKNGVLLLGGGGHCLSILDVLESAQIPVAGIVHGIESDFIPVGSYPPLGRDANLPDLRNQYFQALVTVGQMKNCGLRKRLFEMLCDKGFSLPIVVSPFAYLSSRASLGKGTVVMHQALVNAEVTVGENTIINTKVLVEHECSIGSHCHISIGAVLAGGVVVGDGSFVGAGAIIREGVHIGSNCFIGMGSKVQNDLGEGERYVG